LHADRQSYLAAVGVPAAETAGSSLVRRTAKGIAERRIDLRGDRADYLTAALPHELTHVILADRFAGRQLPRWANEGMAILADPAEKRELHRRDLISGCTQGTLIRLSELLALDGYPPADRWPVFYGQSVSLVEYLVDLATSRQFAIFLEHAYEGGFDQALRRNYGIRDVDELDRRWRASLRATAVGKTASSPLVAGSH
jgi:hypothetical protein